MVKMQRIIGLHAVLLFLTFVSPCIGDTDSETVAVFKNDETEVSYEEGDEENIKKIKPRAFSVPAFVGGVIKDKEFLAVLCEARYNGSSKWGFIEGAARISYGNYKTWSDAKIFAKHTRKSKNFSSVRDITAVMKGEKIYALVASLEDATFTLTRKGSNTGWDPLMFVGTVMNGTESDTGGFSVTWDEGPSLKHLLPKTVLNGKGVWFIGGVGNGVVTKNGTIVIPVQIPNTNKKNTAASIIYSADEGTTWNIGAMAKPEVTEGSVVEWGDNKLILFVRCDEGYRRAYESDDMGNTWNISLMFSKVWGNEPNRKGMGSQGSAITAPVDDKNVLLFAHPLNTKGDYTRDTLQLWMSDGKRILCVGTISETGKGDKTGNSILAHVADHLYIVHEINPPEHFITDQYELKKMERFIAISPLPQLFETVKNTVRTWRQLDSKLQTINITTDGLVGFLRDSNNETVWADWYNCVNATVNGATRVTGGFLFNATGGSGAKWPVKKQGQNQVYRFTKYQFTIAATVKIHATSDTEDISLLGAIEDKGGNKVLPGIGYTKENKWYAVPSKGGKKILSETSVVLDKEYHVAITFANGESSVYVDGAEIRKGKHPKTPKTTSISHFYMGGSGKSSAAISCSCTVKNVMLFNRKLSQTEIAILSTVVKDDKLKNVKLTDKHKGVAVSSRPASAVTQTISEFQDDESPSTTKPISEVQDDESLSTTKPISEVQDDESPSTTKPISEVQDDESPSTTKPISEFQDDESPSTTKPISEVQDDESLSTTKPISEVQDDESPSTTKPISEFQDDESPSTTKPISEVQDEELPSTTKPIREFKDVESHSMTKPAIVKEDDMRSTVGEPKDTSAAVMQRFSEGNGIRNGQRDAVTGAATYLKNHSGQTVIRVENTNHSLQDYHEGDFQHKDKGTDGAVMPLPFVSWLFFFYSAIVLLQL